MLGKPVKIRFGTIFQEDDSFDADCKSFYHTDSFAYEIHVFDYHVETGGIVRLRSNGG